MLAKTRGLVLRSVPYRETSLIVTLFTEHFGVQAYMINSVRTAAARGKMALFQPLTLLELVVYHRESASIKRIKEYKCFHPYHTLTAEVRKSAIALFITEILNKSLREEHHPADLYLFLEDSLITLDRLSEGVESFHLVMMIALSRKLGFGPHEAREVVAQSGMSLTSDEEAKLEQLLAASYASIPSSSLDERRVLLEALLRFYSGHIDHFGEMKCLPVLREVLS